MLTKASALGFNMYFKKNNKFKPNFKETPNRTGIEGGSTQASHEQTLVQRKQKNINKRKKCYLNTKLYHISYSMLIDN